MTATDSVAVAKNSNTENAGNVIEVPQNATEAVPAVTVASPTIRVSVVVNKGTPPPTQGPRMPAAPGAIVAVAVPVAATTVAAAAPTVARTLAAAPRVDAAPRVARAQTVVAAPTVAAAGAVTAIAVPVGAATTQQLPLALAELDLACGKGPHPARTVISVSI